MKTNPTGTYSSGTYNRRRFIGKSIGFTLISAIGSSALLAACAKESNEEKEVSPPEDLMQEHGLLNRVLLIYDHCQAQLLSRQTFDPALLCQDAGIIRSFVEDYHEKQEEDYLFPRFEKANILTELVSTLRTQHKAGRVITGRIMQITRPARLTESDNTKLIRLLSDFSRMYRPHEAREDTVLFPAFRRIVSKHEYDALGEEFEKNENKRFGEDGFEKMIAKTEDIERSLGIYELSRFTPSTGQ